jgi:hypothetical protein
MINEQKVPEKIMETKVGVPDKNCNIPWVSHSIFTQKGNVTYQNRSFKNHFAVFS